MKSNILVIPDSYISHFIPSFFLAELFKDKYEIFFAVTNKQLEELVTTNGYKTIPISDARMCSGGEGHFLNIHKNKKPNFWNILKILWKNEIFKYRKLELEKIIAQIKPEIVIIDIFRNTDYFIFQSHSKNIKTFFFNPMPSTYEVENYPNVRQSTWSSIEYPLIRENNIKQKILNLEATIIKYFRENEINELFKKNKIPTKNKKLDTTFIFSFDNVPELILIPLEFEFSHSIRKEFQHYLGLSQPIKRQETGVDKYFEDTFMKIKNKKSNGFKIIYCCFGTFYNGPDSVILNFVEQIIQTVNNIKNTILVCSLNKLIINFLQLKGFQNDNIFFFSYLSQIEVLQIADLFITHGGMGSIKESINNKVPMLVYPLDLNNDQNGNGLKVEFHGLGLRGVFGFESDKNLKIKMERLLNDPFFKKNLKNFYEQITQNYNKSYLNDTVNKITNDFN